jgi:hypothetical protein
VSSLAKLLDGQDWERHRAELAALTARLPGLFGDGSQSEQTRLVVPGMNRTELQMQLAHLARWHEQRAAMLQQAAIRVFLALDECDPVPKRSPTTTF